MSRTTLSLVDQEPGPAIRTQGYDESVSCDATGTGSLVQSTNQYRVFWTATSEVLLVNKNEQNLSGENSCCDWTSRRKRWRFAKTHAAHPAIRVAGAKSCELPPVPVKPRRGPCRCWRQMFMQSIPTGSSNIDLTTHMRRAPGSCSKFFE
jgi:hypothetical protein